MSSVRLDSTTQDKLRQMAARKGISVSEVHRQALEQYFERESDLPQKSRYSDIIGIFDSGEANLSTRHKEVFREILNRKYEATQSND
ncbi:MAG: ribbon-helix-helix protein, CopG family [Capsulimonas sp.]|uniref:CopG family ribbon-helix-helix protein n=1 Tax=Capsulimonas sp. TaxID=2494211 RepID=UPI003264980B